LPYLSFCVLSEPPPPHLALHSFPTRRSSDLQVDALTQIENVLEAPAFRAGAHDLVGAAPATALDGGQAEDDLAGLHGEDRLRPEDRKSTRLNSSHGSISYAVFCLKTRTRSHE